MKKLTYLIVAIVAFGLIVAGCLPVVPPAPTEQSEPTSLTRGNGIYYVATGGSDTGDGSSGNPWLTITHALTQVSAGDTIIVGPGTYLEWTGAVSAGCAVEVPWFAEGAGGLTIQSSDGPENTIIDCGSAGSGVKIVSNDITFSGFTVKNAYTAVGQVSAKGHTLSNLIITDFVNEGLELMAVHNCQFSDITIHGNDVSKSADRTVKGIDMQEYGSGGNTNNTFEDITIYDIETTGSFGSTYGIYWEGDYQATHPTTGNTFTNVTIHDMTGPWWEAGIYMVGKDTPGDNLPGIEYTTFSGGNIYNCAWAIFVQDGCSDVSISGFDFTNIDYNVIRFEGGGTGLMSNIAITENACLSTTIYTAITVADTGIGSITISNNDVRNNGAGIGIYGSTDATFVKAHYNNIEGNIGYGVKNFGIGTLDATFNWWGDVSGPYHPTSWDWFGLIITNPDGLGDRVSDYVLYMPWLGMGGFVTGGGTIWSVAGNYIWDLNAEGQANFGFVSKYKKGKNVPDGSTNFVFQAGDLHFHSSSYDWLVVTGSDYAKFKGAGIINGSGEYKFRIWARDGGKGGDDTFRIKIWEEDGLENVVYDNGTDQVIDSGSIIIHTK